MSQTPRHVRNFFIILEVDGKKTKIATGPSAKNGGFNLSLYQRDHGGVQFVGNVTGTASDDETLVLKMGVFGKGALTLSTKR